MESVQCFSLGRSPWQWKESETNDWSPCSQFPTVVHHELRLLEKIPDEGVEFNERKLQWVGEKDWVFRTSFPTPPDVSSFPNVELVFDGLDTIATVELNGERILYCDNMFLPQRVHVAGKLATGKENELEILFESAARIGKDREKRHGKTFKDLREPSRMYVRKAQYQWGWDWGPAMICSGPYKDIRLEMSTSSLADLHVKTELSVDCQEAKVTLHVEVAHPNSDLELGCSISPPESDEGGTSETTVKLSESRSSYSVSFDVVEPQLWWPRGQGAQALFAARVSLRYKDQTLDTKSTRFGIRRIELVQDPLESDEGNSFYFKINNRPVFCVGTDWIPCSSLLPNITTEFYHKWLDLAVTNNNNMIRIWGGGCYEADAFYDYCDEKGLMVWHDMMFACGIYPTDSAFHESVTAEITAQVKRLRNHACITLWNGDNEFYFMLDRQYVPYDPEEIENFTNFPERILYFKTIPDVLKKLSPEIPYWPSSPFGGNPANSRKVGNIHQWNVWHNSQEHYQMYPQLGGRFVSEYGMHGFPDIRTVKYFAPDPKTRYPNSRVMDCHNKSKGAETKMGKYLSANYRVNWDKMEDYVYASQLMQCEALTYANRAWRRGWKGPGKEECGGILIWQLNDIYPVTSWALVDSFFRKKPAYFTTMRDYASVVVGISRMPVWHFIDENNRREHKTDIPTYEVYANSFLQDEKEVELRLKMYDWTTHHEIELDDSVRKRKCILSANRTTELLNLECPSAITEDSYVILAATLHDPTSGEEISRHFSWPEPYRYLLPAYGTDVHAEIEADNVKLTCGKVPIKGLLAYIDSGDGEEADWKDNMYDLMPGETLVLNVQGLRGRPVKTRWLYSWEKEHVSI